MCGVGTKRFWYGGVQVFRGGGNPFMGGKGAPCPHPQNYAIAERKDEREESRRAEE